MGEEWIRMVSSLRPLPKPPFCLLDRLVEIHLCGQFGGSGDHHPIFVGIGGWLFLREQIGKKLVLGIAFSIVGSGLIGYGDMVCSKGSLIGDGCALLGAIAASGYLLVGKKMRKDRDLLSYIFPVYSTAGLILIFLSLIFMNPSLDIHLYLFFPLSPRSHPSIDRSHHL